MGRYRADDGRTEMLSDRRKAVRHGAEVRASNGAEAVSRWLAVGRLWFASLRARVI